VVATQIMMLAALSTVDRGQLSTDPPLEATGLGDLYAEHFRAVWRNLRRLGVPEACLDDAVQDVFLVLHRRASEFAGRSSLKTWIFGIVFRVSKDYRRAARRHAARAARYPEAVGIEPEASCPAEQAARREASRVVRAILDQFDDQEQAVFVLVELEQLSLREAAQATGLRLATCQRRLRRARTAFDLAVKRFGEQGRPRP
jgi:RNA polymerase sigma-70 factor, ECF subfamily